MSDERHDALHAHADECDECGRAGVAALSARLRGGVGQVDASRMSARVMEAAAPMLSARVEATFWRSLTRTLAAALLPLPLVVAVDLWLLGWLYALVAAWLPESLALYVVLSYAASLAVLLSGTYAAIPLLLARPRSEHHPVPA